MKKRKKDKVSADTFMMLAENAKAINIYAGLSGAGQQLLLESFAKSDSAENKKHMVDELTK